MKIFLGPKSQWNIQYISIYLHIYTHELGYVIRLRRTSGIATLSFSHVLPLCLSLAFANNSRPFSIEWLRMPRRSYLTKGHYRIIVGPTCVCIYFRPLGTYSFLDTDEPMLTRCLLSWTKTKVVTKPIRQKFLPLSHETL